MPFHSDADEFPEEAFEEATKVRSLDDLVAATACGGIGDERTEQRAAPSEDEERSVRADSTLADPPAPEEPKPSEDDAADSAPGLPMPPEAGAAAATRPGKLLDTTPSPRPSAEPDDEPARAEPEPPPAAPQMKTRLGVEAPAKRPTTPPADVRRTPEPAPVSARDAAPKRPSTAPIWIGGLVVVAIGLAAVWYFFLRNDLQQRAADDTGSAELASGSPETPGSAATPGSAVAMTGSAGSDVAMTGSAGSAGSAEAMASETPTGPTANTIVAADIAKATVEVEGTDQHGTVPFTAKLVQGQSYKVRVTAPGYLAQELDVPAGKDKVVAKLVAKPHVVSVKSTPPGAAIYVDGSNTGKYTPYDVELTASQAARPRVRVTLRKSGYATREQVIPSSGFTEEDARLTASVDATLPVSVPLHTSGGSSAHHSSGTGSGTATGSAGSASTSGSGDAGSASGSAATQPEGGETSPDTGATKPDTGTTKPDTGAGSAAAKPSGGEAGSGAAAAGSADPSPSWAH
jgi:hypothetical protein